MNSEQDIALFDQIFDEWKRKYPNGKFSDFSARRVVSALRNGKEHPALGENLRSGDWWKDGIYHFNLTTKFFSQLMDIESISEDAIVCDYGCGSLRIGAHFIKRQSPGCFIGMDVSNDLLSFGVDKLGNLVSEKAPILGTIREKLSNAIELNVDLLFSINVSYHVHPEEISVYYNNLKKIAHKPGSIVVLHVCVSKKDSTSKPIRFQRSGWAWPLDFYIKMMRPLMLKMVLYDKTFTRNNISLGRLYLAFQRPADKLDNHGLGSYLSPLTKKIRPTKVRKSFFSWLRR